MREDVYKVVRAVYTNQEEMAQLSAEDRRLVEKIEQRFRRSGLLLPQDKREELTSLRKQLVDITQQHSRNTDEEVEMETSLRAKLAPLGQQELVELQALKKEYVEAAGLPYEGFYKWDKEFFTNLQFEQKYQVKSELVKEYFPMIQVQQGILDIYQQMLGLKLVKVEHPE
ncbi:metalloendopeptidase, partial [Coemansia sp. Cherry 401B]